MTNESLPWDPELCAPGLMDGIVVVTESEDGLGFVWGVYPDGINNDPIAMGDAETIDAAFAAGKDAIR